LFGAPSGDLFLEVFSRLRAPKRVFRSKSLPLLQIYRSVEDPPSSALRAPPVVAARANRATTATPLGQNNHQKWCLSLVRVDLRNISQFRASTRPPRATTAPPRAATSARSESSSVHLTDPPTTVRSPPRTPPSDSSRASTRPLNHLRVGFTRLRRRHLFRACNSRA
jgi:hypothetical protein